jgi:hypothetical protein
MFCAIIKCGEGRFKCVFRLKIKIIIEQEETTNCEKIYPNKSTYQSVTFLKTEVKMSVSKTIQIKFVFSNQNQN